MCSGTMNTVTNNDSNVIISCIMRMTSVTLTAISQLSTHHSSVRYIPEIGTNSAPCSTDAYPHCSSTWPVTTSEPYSTLWSTRSCRKEQQYTWLNKNTLKHAWLQNNQIHDAIVADILTRALHPSILTVNTTVLIIKCAVHNPLLTTITLNSSYMDWSTALSKIGHSMWNCTCKLIIGS